MREKFFAQFRIGSVIKRDQLLYSRFKVGAIQRVLVDVFNHRIIQKIFDRAFSSDEASRECRRHIIRHPIRHDCDVSPVLAEQIRVEYELLGVAAAARYHHEAMLAEN